MSVIVAGAFARAYVNAPVSTEARLDNMPCNKPFTEHFPSFFSVCSLVIKRPGYDSTPCASRSKSCWFPLHLTLRHGCLLRALRHGLPQANHRKLGLETALRAPAPAQDQAVVCSVGRKQPNTRRHLLRKHQPSKSHQSWLSFPHEITNQHVTMQTQFPHIFTNSRFPELKPSP